MGKFDGIDFSPVSRSKNREQLKELLIKDRIKKICLHKWIYWTYGPAPKLHRVCEKCYKKQQNSDLLNHSNIWRKDKPKVVKTKSDIRDIKIDSILS